MEDKVFNNLKRKGKKGFTLIEMIIVIVIIGILAMMAVSSFGTARKRARLNIAVDSVASMIKQQQDKAKTGRQTEDSLSAQQSSCYGMVFQKTVPYLQTVTVPYVAVPPVGQNSPFADYCDTTPTVAVLTPVEVTDDIMVQDIKKAGAPDPSALVLMFKPPFGAVFQADGIDNITPQSLADTSTVQVFLNQTDNLPTDEQGIQYEPFSGAVSKASPSTP